MKSMVKNKGILSFIVFMIGVSYFYSVSLKDNSNVEMITSDVITTQEIYSNEI